MQGARVRLSVPPGGVGSGAAAVAPTLPADADALFAQGMEHYRRREWGQAREYFVRAKEIEPSRRGMDALLSELDTFLQLERAESAPSPRPKAAAAPRARRWPAVALVLVTLAVAIAALIYTGILPTPLTSTSIALGTAAEVQRHINRGHALFVTEMYEDAIESFNQALELDPDNVDALAALQEAEEYLRMEALYAEATRLIEQEQHDLAAAKLREIIEIDPWHKNAGVLLARSERYHEVDTLYEEAVGYYQAGEWAKATSAFQAVLDKDPSHGYEDLDTMLFESYLNDGRQRIANARSSLDIIEASQSLDEALEILPFDTEAQQEKGLASLYADAYSASRRSDWRRAVVALSQIYDVRPDYAGGQAAETRCEAYMGLADDHRAAGDLQLALDQYLVMLSMTECDEAVVRAKQQEILELLPQTMPTPLPESE